MGYHLDQIKRGIFGELSKVQEELDEAADAQKQGCRIMLLVELSDLIGAVEAVAEKNGSSLDELISMQKITKRVFQSGHRESR